MTRKELTCDPDDVIGRYLNGVAARRIANELGQSEKAVIRLLQDRGLFRTKGEARRSYMLRQRPDISKVGAAYLAGTRTADLAEFYGVAQATIIRWIREAGVEISLSTGGRQRWAGMTPAEREEFVQRVRDAMLGYTRTENELSKRAITCERHPFKVGAGEGQFGDWLTQCGMSVTPQKAAGRYNIDLAVDSVFAVEIFGGMWHGYGDHAARLPRRTRYLFDSGWHVYIVWTHAKFHPLTTAAADDFVAFSKVASLDPSARRQYRVVWGDGQFISSGSADDDEWTLIPSGPGQFRRRT